MNTEKMIIFADGASHGNPGPAAIGAVIKDGQGALIARISQRIGETTNNQAEYRAVIIALAKALRLGAGQVEIRSDSELVVRQINGQYRVKEASLKPLHHRVKQLQSRLKDFAIIHISGEENTEAHNLASLALM